MKTALIKTTIWDDDTFYGLNIDTKIIYMLLLTSPERGVSRIFKMSNRLISARSGLNDQQISICKKQLEDLKIVYFIDGWIYLTEKSSFIQPVRGKLTYKTLIKEIMEVPEYIFNKFALLTDMKDYISHRRDSCQSHVHDNDKDNDIDNDIDIDNVFDNDEGKGYAKYLNTKKRLFSK